MRELRKDPLRERWVILASNRAHRPYGFKTAAPSMESTCGYCSIALEEKTPFALPPQFFALSAGRESVDAVRGQQETLIESRQHGIGFDQMPEEDGLRAVLFWVKRLSLTAKIPGIRHTVIHKTDGMTDPTGKKFFRHPTSEVTALPIVADRVYEELLAARRFLESKKTCVFCHLLRHERDLGSRLVETNEHFLALCPFASQSPFEIFICPLQHASDMRDISKTQALALVSLLRNVLTRLRRTLKELSYYLVIHTAPFESGDLPMNKVQMDAGFHWHVEIKPRNALTAGFEWGSGVYINPTPPEEAAEQLRDKG